MLFLFNPRSEEQIKRAPASDSGYFYKSRVRYPGTCDPSAQMMQRKQWNHQGKNVDVIVCSGGDGTLNETISGMLMLKKHLYRLYPGGIHQ